MHSTEGTPKKILLSSQYTYMNLKRLNDNSNYCFLPKINVPDKPGAWVNILNTWCGNRDKLHVKHIFKPPRVFLYWNTQSPRRLISFKTYLGHCQGSYGKRKNILPREALNLFNNSRATTKCIKTMFTKKGSANVWNVCTIERGPYTIGLIWCAMKNKGNNGITFWTKKRQHATTTGKWTIHAQFLWGIVSASVRHIQYNCLTRFRIAYIVGVTRCPLKPVQLACWLALAGYFVTSKKYDRNLIMPKNWTTLPWVAVAFNGIWLFQWNASCKWKNYSVNIAQNTHPFILFLSTIIISLHIATTVSSTSLPWTWQEVIGVPQSNYHQ